MTTTAATRFLWRAAGEPWPCETTGERIVPRGAPRGVCATCGDGPAAFALDDAFSSNFWPVRNLDKMFPFGGVRACAACVWCTRTLALRCAAWFATEQGFYFVTRRSLLACLLSPPAPPFVAGVPLYGMAHGGEANLHRCMWAGATPPDPLVRLQSKHVAIYSALAHDAGRYTVQVDDSLVVPVDVPMWRGLLAACTEIVAELRAGRLGATEIRDALRTLRLPASAPLATAARWARRVAPLRATAGAAWWPLFCDLVPMPPLPDKPERAPAPASIAIPAPAAAPDGPSRRPFAPQLTLW